MSLFNIIVNNIAITISARSKINAQAYLITFIHSFIHSNKCIDHLYQLYGLLSQILCRSFPLVQ